MGSPSVVRRSTSSFGAAIASNDHPGPTDLVPEIKGSQGLHDALFEFAPDAMLSTDQEGRIREVNAETEKQFGYSRQELMGKSIEELIPVRFREAHRLHWGTY